MRTNPSSNKTTLTGAFSRKALKSFGLNPSKGMKKHGKTILQVNPLLSHKAINAGLIRLKPNGEIDRLCLAVRNGDVIIRPNGEVDPQSKLVKAGDIVLQKTNACHIQSFEVTDAVMRRQNITLTREECEETILALNANDNLQLKSRAGNMNGTKSMEGKGDHALDREIIDGIRNGTRLSKKASDRAHAIINIVLNSKGRMPDKVIEAFREDFSNLKDVNDNQICRKNAKIYEIEEGKSRRNVREGLRKDGRITWEEIFFEIKERARKFKEGRRENNEKEQKEKDDKKEKEKQRKIEQRAKEQREIEQQIERNRIQREKEEREKEQREINRIQREKQQKEELERKQQKYEQQLLIEQKRMTTLFRNPICHVLNFQHSYGFSTFFNQNTNFQFVHPAFSEDRTNCCFGFVNPPILFNNFAQSPLTMNMNMIDPKTHPLKGRHYEWNGNLDGPKTKKGLPDMRYKVNRM